MKTGDPLASPTLAQLYLAQGHDAQAAEVLAAVLARDPTDGQALALERRVAARSRARIALERPADRLVVRYEGCPTGTSVHAVVAAWRPRGGDAAADPIRSQRCATPRGELFFPASPGRGSACACLVCLDPDGRLSVLAVAEPLCW